MSQLNHQSHLSVRFVEAATFKIGQETKEGLVLLVLVVGQNTRTQVPWE